MLEEWDATCFATLQVTDILQFWFNETGFTPLCEKVSPDTAGKVLEIFYNIVETAAEAEKHDILVKRLGDGLFLTWGFKLAVRPFSLYH